MSFNRNAFNRPDVKRRRRRARIKRYGETGLVGLVVALTGIIMTALYVLVVAAPWIIVALVLHWLGAF